MGRIIAIVGMCGSGKSIASEKLEKLGFKKVYFGGVTFDKLKEAGIEANPQSEKMMREKLRSELGMGAYAIILTPKIKELALNNDVVLDGLYSWDELKLLKDAFPNLVVISIVADKKLRYSRLGLRSVRPFTKEEAVARDIAEIENVAKAGPIAFADYFIFNNSTVEDFYDRLDEILKAIEA